MDILDPPIQTEHPPHPGARKKNRFSLRGLFPRITLFLLILSFMLHVPDYLSGTQNRERTIEEIRAILEKRQTDLSSASKAHLAEVIYEEALRYNHDPKFILALIEIESSFFNWAVSEKGAKGLMQIMPEVAKSAAHELGIEWMGDRTLFNPNLNVRIGIYYLSRLVTDFRDLGTALTAYNYGPTYVRSLLERKERIPLSYYRRILSVYQNL
jgi:soluble lytic murein transglycosylase-like protein